MQKILCLAAAATLGCGRVAMADESTAAIRDFGLLGTWASYCSAGYDRREPGLRVAFGAPPDGPPTYTTAHAEDGITTTVHAAVLEAAPAGAGRLRLRLQITGGDRNGGPLPEPTTNPSEQEIDKVEGQGIRVVGLDPRFIQKCPE